MGILKDRPFVLRNIVAFLVIKVLAGLEIDCVPKKLSYFLNDNDGR